MLLLPLSDWRPWHQCQASVSSLWIHFLVDLTCPKGFTPTSPTFASPVCISLLNFRFVCTPVPHGSTRHLRADVTLRRGILPLQTCFFPNAPPLTYGELQPSVLGLKTLVTLHFFLLQATSNPTAKPSGSSFQHISRTPASSPDCTTTSVVSVWATSVPPSAVFLLCPSAQEPGSPATGSQATPLGPECCSACHLLGAKAHAPSAAR